MMDYKYLDELYHYGIFGMKWGVRRYQNKDGSLTSLGKSRKLKENAGTIKSKNDYKVDKLTQKTTQSKETTKTKKTSEMTDAELQAVINRMRLEQEYSRYVKTETKKIKMGERFVEAAKDAAVNSFKASATNLMTQMINYEVGNFINDVVYSNKKNKPINNKK